LLVGTLILFVLTLIAMYWFRYTCLVILRTQTAKDYSKVVAEANGLTFLETRGKLEREGRDTLDNIQQSLHRDYELVCSLLQHTSAPGSGSSAFQRVLLRFDYFVMRSLYPVARVGSRSLARYALIEMASVVSYLAHCMGERGAAFYRA
jgi:hypothetical protein